MQTILKQLNHKDLSERYRNHIEEWVKLWQGEIVGFHQYREFNGREYVNRHRKTLGMGKKVCEDWADTLYNPETKITIGESKEEKQQKLQEVEVSKETEEIEAEQGVIQGTGEVKEKAYTNTLKRKAVVEPTKQPKTKAEVNQEKLDEILEDNDFVNKYNVLLEKTWAFGTGATVVNKDQNGKVKIDFVDARNIYPLKTYYGDIVQVAFSSRLSHELVALQIHSQAGDLWEVENHIFKKEEASYIPMDLPKNMEEKFTSEVKLFQIIKPALANNIDIDQPLGLSVLANAVDEIKGVDQAYTALDNELTTGRIRAFIQAGGLKYGIDEDGHRYPHYDKNQQEYYILPEDTVNDKGTFIEVDTPQIRVPQIEQALEKHLTLCGRKVGFGDDSYSFRDGSVYTNTAQIISTNSKFFKTRQKHLSVLEKQITLLVKAVMWQYDKTKIDEVSIDFDDSIIEDSQETFDRSLLLLNGGHISIQEFFERTENLTPKLAQELVDKINEDKNLDEEIGFEGEDYFAKDEEDEEDEKSVNKIVKALTETKGE